MSLQSQRQLATATRPVAGPPWPLVSIASIAKHHSGNSKLIKGKLHDAPSTGLFPAFSASGQDVWHADAEHKGDAIIISAVGARCGKCFLARGEWSAVANTHVVWPDALRVELKWLWYLLNDEQFWIRSGSAQPFVAVRKTFEKEIALPPLDEQHRIVAEIEKQFTRLDAGVAALRRVQANLKRYRASILKSACEGRLVPTETPWPQRPIALAIESLDQGWSPKCDTGPAISTDEWGVIKTTAIQPMRYLDEENKRLPPELKPRPQHELKPWDLLVTRAGPRSRVGIACLVRRSRSKLMLCDKAYRIRCKRDKADPAFIELALNAPHIVDAIDRLKSGISDSGLNLTQKRFCELVIPLPSLAEQVAVVAEVDRRLSVLDELEALVSANLQRAARLRQSILQKAFSGELVHDEATT